MHTALIWRDDEHPFALSLRRLHDLLVESLVQFGEFQQHP